MGASNFDFAGGAMHGRMGQVGDQGTGFQSNSTKFAGLGTTTQKFGEAGGDQPINANENKFAGNSGMKLAGNGNG
jgi:hypothetical protein